MRPRGGISLTSSPTMVGAITVLISLVAVFLAYNANHGLPFVTTYRVTAQVPDAASLVPGDDVRVGGVRVGMIEAIDPVQEPNGSTAAQLQLKLDRSLDPLPRDSRVVVRTQSALGLKYLEIDRGHSSRGYPEGSVMPLSAARPHPVDLDQVLGTFNRPTRSAIQQNLVEFGDALAGRGPDLNAAIGDLRPLFPLLKRVSGNLAAPSTGLDRFFRALEATVSELAPVAETQARMFDSLDTTFAALARVAVPSIQQTISETPRTLAVGTRDFPVIRPFLRHSASLFVALRPGIASLEANAPALASSLETGARVLPRAPILNRGLPPVARALQDLNNDPHARAGIDRLHQSFDLLDTTLGFVTPAQTVCNYGTILLHNTQNLLSQGDGLGGTWLRFEVFSPPLGPAGAHPATDVPPNGEGSPSSGPANGPSNATEPPNANFLHANPYPNTAAPGQARECEAGNEPYIVGQQVIGNVPGNQGTVTEGQP